MTSKKYLSNKKTANQNISITPALKEWVERYVRVKHKENPRDESYKSVSSFYCSVIENVLSIFKEGKTLDDFDRLRDNRVSDYYDKDEAKIFVPIVDQFLRESRYTNIDFEANAHYYLGIRDILLDGIEPHDIERLKIVFERIRNQYLSSGLTKEIKLDLFTDKNKKKIKGVLEHFGHYKNLHYLNCKNMAGGLGIFGIKVKKFFIGDKGLFYRMELETTDLAFSKDLVIEERLKLLENNTSFIINNYEIIKDNDYYLWQKMADDYNNIITFKNQKDFDKFINNVEKDLQKYSDKEDFLLIMMEFFEKLHWIKIKDINESKFQFVISEEFERERQFVRDYFSNYAEILEENGNIYLKNN